MKTVGIWHSPARTDDHASVHTCSCKASLWKGMVVFAQAPQASEGPKAALAVVPASFAAILATSQCHAPMFGGSIHLKCSVNLFQPQYNAGAAVLAPACWNNVICPQCWLWGEKGQLS